MLVRVLMQGVQSSDTLVLMNTRGVLTRPWCLLEIYEATKAGLPVVVVNMVGGSYPHDDQWVRELLSHLETRLPELNPLALPEVRICHTTQHTETSVFS